MRYQVQPNWGGTVYLYDGPHQDAESVHVFTDADLGRDGHERITVLNGIHVVWGHDDTTHVAIPVEQYVRIFGEL